jgi:hypothetical protein
MDALDKKEDALGMEEDALDTAVAGAPPAVQRQLPPAGHPGLAGGFVPALMGWSEATMESVCKKAHSVREPIHGGKYMAKLGWFREQLTKEEQEFTTALEEACMGYAATQSPRVLDWVRCDFSFLFGPPGTGPQEWHFDTLVDAMAISGNVSGPPRPHSVCAGSLRVPGGAGGQAA